MLSEKSYGFQILNAVLFYFGWLAVVTSAAADRPAIGILFSFFVVLWHLLFVRNKLREFFLIAGSLVAGFFVETMMVKFLILSYASPNTLWPGYAPFWILSLYAIFPTTLNHALGWLRPYQFLAAFVGFLGGMLSYSAGEYLGAVDFLMPKGGSMMAVGIFWFMLLPLLYIYNDILRHLTSDR